MVSNTSEINDIDIFKESREYWLRKLSGGLNETIIAADFFKKGNGAAKAYTTELPEELTERLGKLSKNNDLALYVVLLAGLKLLLSKFTGQEDILVVSPTYRQEGAGSELIRNELVILRDSVQNEISFRELLKTLKATVLEAYKNQYYPLDKVFNDLEINYKEFISNCIVLSLDSIHERDYNPENGRIIFSVSKGECRTALKVSYSSGEFAEETIKRLAEHYINILNEATLNLDKEIQNLEVITKDEKKLLMEFNDTRDEYPGDKTIHELLEAQAKKTPQSTAIVFGDRELTYEELNKKSNQVAKILREKGVRPDSIVGIMIERSPEMLIGIIGVLKAGGAYLPIDPEYPEDRIAFMLEDSKTNILLSSNAFKDRIEFNGDILDLRDESIYLQGCENLKDVNNPNDLAYVIYTSGSTGKPKGVMIEHRQVVNFIEGMTMRLAAASYKTILCVTTISFDIFVMETLVPLAKGLKVVIANEEEQIEGRKLNELIIKNSVDVMQITPSRLQMLMLDDKFEITLQLIKMILIGGEALPAQVVDGLSGNPELRIYNMYGPTETTVWSTVKEIVPGGQITIGRPIANTQVYIVDKNMNLQPLGVLGEIYLAGDGLARGYLNKPELTAERFVPNPFDQGKRMYKTGDLGRWLAKGEIEFLGRADYQVKIRGYRIELGEIENQIHTFKGIERTIVVDREDESNIKYLCAYIVSNCKVSIDELKEHLAAKLPEYMMPSYFIQIDELPLTPNGKVDRKKLPVPESGMGIETVYAAPRDEVERKLADIWSEVFGREKVGINDDFFELGGHSLKATILASKIRKEIGAEVPIGEIFNSPTIKGISQYIRSVEKVLCQHIEKGPDKDYYEASMVQNRMYMLQQMDLESVGYNMPGAVEIQGDLDVSRLEESIKEVIRRHDSLRTSFSVVEDRVVQSIRKEVDFKISYVESLDTDIAEFLGHFIKPFDLASAPLLRICIVKLEKNRHALVFDMHHIISDGMSISIMGDEIFRLYSGEKLDELKIQYKDYSEWQRKLVQSGSLKGQEEYWVNTFSDDIPILNIPTDFERPAVKGFEGEIASIRLERQLVKALKELVRETGSTMYIVMLSALNILLSKYSGQEDIIIGTPSSGRTHAELEEVIGIFINTLAMRNHPAKDKTYEEFLTEVKKSSLKAFENQDYEFRELLDKLNLGRDFSRNPLFDVMFVMQNMEMDRNEFNGLTFNSYPVKHKVAKLDLTFTVKEFPNDILIVTQYDIKLFKAETVERMMRHFSNILNQIVAMPKVKLSEIDMLSSEERKKILYEFNNTSLDYSKAFAIHKLFEEQAKRTPENIALVFNEEKLTYKELDIKSNKLARNLRNKGVKQDSIVALIAEPSMEMIVAMIGILKAGGAYLPISHEYPEDRIRYILEDSKTNIILTQSKFADLIPFDGEILDLCNESEYVGEGEELSYINSLNDLAYVIYTSGTTGKPKGVMIEHKNLLAYVNAFQHEYRLGEMDNVLQQANYSFDAFVEEVYPALTVGGKVFIVNKYDALNLAYIEEFVYRNKINLISCSPLFINELNKCSRLESVHTFISGGDVLKKEYFSNLIKHSKVYNTCGPTETTVCFSYYNCPKEIHCSIPIGKPISNYKIYIVDSSGNLAPIGVVGEICVSGDGLARGYLNSPELTAQRFVDNPFISGEKMYKTGDLGKWFPDGNIEFLGRVDHQVKIRGFRIEIGEIESQLLNYEGIKEAVVIDREDKKGGKYLCAYISADKEFTVAEIREYLSKDLPEYMIPSYYVNVEKIPQTSNGKVDRRALLELDANILTGAEYEAPRNDVEEKLCAVWEEVLHVEKVGIADNFFELGGDSIKAIQVMARIKKYGYSFEMKDLFRHPYIKGLGEYAKANSIQIDQGIVEGETLLTPIQKWFFEQNFTDMHHWNQSVMLFKKDGFQEQIVEKVVEAILLHHDALRMIYKIEGKAVRQINRGSFENMCNLKIFDFRGINDYEQKIAQEAERIQGSIDLSDKALIKLGLFKTDEGDHLLIVVHHLLIDGISWRIFFEDFSAGYIQCQNNQEIVFQEKTTSYKDWAKQLKDYSSSKKALREIDYWRKIEETEIKPLPKDQELEGNIFKGSRRTGIMLTEEETERLLRKTNPAYNTEINDILLSALALTIKEWTGENNVLIDLEGHGRENILEKVDISRTVGWFTSIYPVALNISRPEDVAYSIKNIKETLRHIPNKGIGYGIIKYLTDETLKKDLKFSLSPEISFNYLGQFDQDIPSGVFGMSRLPSGKTISSNNKNQYTLSINGAVASGRLGIAFTYNSMQYNDKTVQDIAEQYKKNLIMLIDHCTGKTESETTPTDLGDEELTIEELETVKNTIGSTASDAENQELQNIYVLSPMQEGMLFHTLLSSESGAYFESVVYTMKGDLDIRLFQESFDRLAKRYDILRTIFMYENLSRPRQVVLKSRTGKIHFEDISGLTEEHKKVYIEEFIRKDKEKGFCLSKDMLMRIAVLKTHPDEYVVAWSQHHILMDGWCLGIIFKDVMRIYGSLKNGAEPKLDKTYPYMNYIKWINSQDNEEAKDYWTSYLNDYSTKASLPSNYKKDSSSYKKGELAFKLDETLTSEIEGIVKTNQVTTSIFIQAVWGILLQRYNNSDDVVFGAVVSGRSPEVEGIESMVGLFINTIPVRVKAAGGLRFRELIKMLNNDMLVSNKYSYHPLAKVQGYTSLKNDLINNIIVFENYPIEREMEKGTDANSLGLTVRDVRISEQTNYDMNLIVAPGKEISIKLQYNADMYDKAAIEMIARHLNNIASIVAKDSEIPVEEIGVLSEEEKHKLLYGFNDTFAEYPKEKTIYELFEQQAERTPENIAVVFENEKLTYRQLNQKANRLARTLREKGVGPDSIVGIMVEKSLEMIIGIMGILKAGGAYLPIDPDYPEDRIKYMLDDSRIKILLTQKHLLHRVSFEGEVIDLFDDAVYAKNEDNLEKINSSKDLAYIIYTSGSTGTPKGVMIEHRSLVNLCIWHNADFDITADDRAAQYASISFDASVWEMFPYLICGASIYIIPSEMRLYLEQLNKYYELNDITISFLPTQVCEEFIKLNNSSLKKLITGGDKLKNYTNKSYSIVNNYGPTENTVVATKFVVDKQYRNIPIGKGISNNYIYILDSHNNIQPIGVPGELCISGEGLARGYLNNPELTKEKFVDNPFVKGGRMYRTGDLAKWLPDGNIEFLGRIDRQVKIRGFRIELEEIENNILSYSGVRETIVSDLEDENGSKYLCAYMVAESEIIVRDIRNHLLKKLPDYMVPAYFVQLECLPLTSSGKIDRKALPKPSGNVKLGTEYEAPRDEIEEKLCRVWEDVLGVDKVGINDNFFELGGHSLKATVLIGRIHKVLEVQVPLKEVFMSPTIKGISEYIRSTARDIYLSIERAPERDYYEASSAQKRMYMLQQFDLNSTAYNIPSVIEIEGKLNKEKVESTVKKLLERHESLRTYFETIEGRIVQKISKDTNFEIEYEEGIEETYLESAATAQLEVCNEQGINLAVKNFVRAFDLGKAPLFRVGLIKVQPEKYILMFDMHHIISDGVSMGILLSEFLKLYQGQELKESKLQYKDYSEWQNNLLKSDEMRRQENYWLNKFNDEIPVLNMTTDHQRPSIKSFEGDTIDFNLSAELTKRLKRLGQETESTLYMVLLSAINILLSKYSGQEDIIIGSPIAGRPHTDLEDIIGIFVNTIAVRNKPHGEKTYEEFLGEVRENALGAFENQLYPFEELIEKLKLTRDMSRNPLFDVMFVLQNMENKQLRPESIGVKQYKSGNKTSKFDFTIAASEAGEEIRFSIEYDTKLFEKRTIGRMAGHLINILNSIAGNRTIKLKDIELLRKEEKHELLYEFNATHADYARNKTLHQIFEEQVEKTPDNTAVVFEDNKLTYKELNEKANRLARTLKKRGVKPDGIVAIMTERSQEMIVGIMAILKAGGAYLPIDPEYPEDRIKYIFEDSKAKIILIQNKFMEKAAVVDGERICLEDESSYADEGDNLEAVNSSKDLAYVIYTSGSTGLPKGVMIEHHSVINRINWMQKSYPISEADVIMQKTTYTFDVSVWELFWWSFVGASVCLLPPKGERDPEEILNCIEKNNITTMHFVPSMFSGFMLYVYVKEEKNRLSGLKQIFCSGEALTKKQVEMFGSLTENIRLINLYGPTEATVDVSHYECLKNESSNSISIGKPIDNICLYIIGSNNQLQPAGVAGELCISGVGLARGYLNKAELTKEKFIENPFIKGERMYKTGDLARWLPDGNIEYLGRIDHQVKIRGFRIELGEIEAVLRKHPAVKETVVVARKIKGELNDSRLIAYLTLDGEERPSDELLRSFLRSKLPEYMLPSHFIVLEDIPLTSNGKVNVKALPELDSELLNTGENYVEPSTSSEKTLAEIWTKVLKLDKIGVNDNFFNSGGDSILSIQVVSLAKEKGLNLSIQQIFLHPTIAELAKEIDLLKPEAVPKQKTQAFSLLSEKDRAKLLKLNSQQNSSHKRSE